MIVENDGSTSKLVDLAEHMAVHSQENHFNLFFEIIGRIPH